MNRAAREKGPHRANGRYSWDPDCNDPAADGRWFVCSADTETGAYGQSNCQYTDSTDLVHVVLLSDRHAHGNSVA